MSLQEKGKVASYDVKEYYPTGSFSASGQNAQSNENIYAATLNNLEKAEYLNSLGVSPVNHETAVNIEATANTKNEEFYTRYEDIEAEMMHYREQFNDKTIYLPCDDPAEKKSEFWSFFVNNFDAFGLRKLIATSYNENGEAYKIWIERNPNNESWIDDDDALQEDLTGDGDFRSEECIEILKECDIVITNPPLSLFGELVSLILTYNKDFLLVGFDHKIIDKTIFPYIKNEYMRCGYNSIKVLKRSDGTMTKFTNIRWFTTLRTYKPNSRKMELTESYSPALYPTYDHVDAIEVSRVANIPKDYDGWMGVPTTIICNTNFSTDQFEIIGMLYSSKTDDAEYNYGKPQINGKLKYDRILIKRR